MDAIRRQALRRWLVELDRASLAILLALAATIVVAGLAILAANLRAR